LKPAEFATRRWTRFCLQFPPLEAPQPSRLHSSFFICASRRDVWHRWCRRDSRFEGCGHRFISVEVRHSSRTRASKSKLGVPLSAEMPAPVGVTLRQAVRKRLTRVAEGEGGEGPAVRSWSGTRPTVTPLMVRAGCIIERLRFQAGLRLEPKPAIAGGVHAVQRRRVIVVKVCRSDRSGKNAGPCRVRPQRHHPAHDPLASVLVVTTSYWSARWRAPRLWNGLSRGPCCRQDGCQA
jgi:hypothetical protein